MMKILANDGLSSEGVALLEKSGFHVNTTKIDQGQLAQAINEENYEVLLVRSATQVRSDLIDRCPGLKLIGRGGVGMDNIDVQYARSRDIKVINTPGASSQSVAELVMAHLFGLCRYLPDSNRKMPQSGSSDFSSLKKAYGKGIELRGKTLGIIGFGRIGQSLASYALGIGMKVLAYDAFEVNTELELNIGGQNVKVRITKTDMEELLAKSEFISLHVPAQKDGRPVIGSEEISKMKDGAMLVNASRGGIIDEEALLSALNSGKLRGAALDVYVGEPNPNEKILGEGKLSLTPHTGAATVEAQDRVAVELAEQIIQSFQPA